MIEGLKPYKKYKPVSTRERHIPWLYELPQHWSVSPSKWLFVQREDRAQPEDQQLSATQAYGVIPQKEFERRVGRKVVQIVQHLDKRRHVECDDFVISMRSFQGGLERAWASGAIRSSYVVLKPTAAVDVGYFAHLFKSTDYISALQRTSNFIRDGQDLNFNNFRLVDLPVVPLEEQRAIAKFIDHADRRIRRYIRAKQKLIKLLEEQKQAIIHQAVTRGLDPNARLKPSGVEWLGDVPEHWEVRPLKALARVQSGVTLGKKYAPGAELHEHPYLRVANVQSGRLDLSVVKTLAVTHDEAQRSNLKPGDVLMTEGGDPDKLGRGCLWRGEIDGCLHQNHVFAVRPKLPRLEPSYLVYALGSRSSNEYFIRTAKQTTNLASTNKTTLGNLPLPIPPLDEQREVLAQLDSALGKLTTAEERARSEIDLLREYRTRLIADVVTGKLDVRQAAANLPDELETDEPELDEADGLEDADDLPDEEADE